MSDELRVEGGATTYRLHDVGYAIALDVAGTLLGDSTRARARPGRGEPAAIEIRNPPLFVTLRTVEIMIGPNRCRATVSAHVFDFGVCSMHFNVHAPAIMSWPDYAEFARAFEAAREVETILDDELAALLDRIAPAVQKPAVAPLSEEYRVYRVDRMTGGPDSERPVSERLSDEALVLLLVGERRRLSSSARRELVPFRFSYYEDDFIVLTWDSALVLEPRAEDRDVEYVLEFANAQLLELRVYDHQLDADLPGLYERASVARASRRPRGAANFRRLLSDLQTRVADITETVERVENALRVTNDVYLARVYAAALELFREQAWRRGIERKLGILRETYAMLNSDALAARTEILEIMVVLLIVAEVVIGLWRGSA